MKLIFRTVDGGTYRSVDDFESPHELIDAQLAWVAVDDGAWVSLAQVVAIRRHDEGRGWVAPTTPGDGRLRHTDELRDQAVQGLNEETS